MTSEPTLVERRMAEVELRPFTLEEFHRRRSRDVRKRRVGTAALGILLLGAALGNIMGADRGRGTSTAEDQDDTIAVSRPFEGAWSSRAADGSPRLMNVQPAETDRVRVQIEDGAAAACAGGPGTWSGVGDVEADGRLLVGAVLTCDDESVRAAPRDLWFRHDPSRDQLVGLDVRWSRPASSDGPIPVVDLPEFADLSPGAYVVDPDGNDATPLRVTFEIANDGWMSWIGAVKQTNESHSALSITTIDNLVRHGCNDHSPAMPPVGPTVDDLADALAQLAPFQVSEPATDVTVRGYRGKHLQLTVPYLATTGPSGDLRFADCTRGQLHSWIAGNLDGAFFGYNGEPGRTEDFWILDVDGARLVLAVTAGPRAPSRDRDELRAILESVEIRP